MHLASSFIHPIRDEGRGKCLIRVFVPEKRGEGHDRPVVLCTELEDNPGLSILHHASRIAGEFLRSHWRAVRDTPVWIEQLPATEREGEEFYLTTFDSHEAREARAPYMGEAPVEIGTPTRKPLDRKAVQTLVGMRV